MLGALLGGALLNANDWISIHFLDCCGYPGRCAFYVSVWDIDSLLASFVEPSQIRPSLVLEGLLKSSHLSELG
jgi:hypothetical protein